MDRKEAIQKLLKVGELPTPEKIAALTEKAEEITVNVPKEEPISKKFANDKNGFAALEIIKNYVYEPKKIAVPDFVTFFRNRYNSVKNLLLNRAEVETAVSIENLSRQADKVTIIAIIKDIQKLPTGTLKLELEDLTGSVTAIISVKDPELEKKAKYLTLDDVLAFKGGIGGKNIFFINDIVWPDIPLTSPAKSPTPGYAIFSSDIHIGSKMFLEKNFKKFISWLQGKSGTSKEKEISKQTKYVFLPGDLVDGVGIYPGQQSELTHDDIYTQYQEVAKYLEQIPSDKYIVIIPGNHDAVRLAEPQPELYKDYAKEIYNLPNIISLSNPSSVRIHKHDDYRGTDVLTYHGYSYDFFIDKIEALRLAGGYERPDLVMQFLLKRRHLAPTYGSTLAIPLPDDPLHIKQVPDIFVSGHIHKASIAKYKSSLMISSSCWQARTNFQERVGHVPDPGIIPLVDLSTQQATALNFME